MSNPASPVELLVDEDRASQLRTASRDWPSWDLTRRQAADLELLATGAFAPLRTFHGRADARRIRAEGRMVDGTPWPTPILLEVAADLADGLDEGAPLALRDDEGVMLAVLTVTERWPLADDDRVAVTGPLEVLELPRHHDAGDVRRTPADVRAWMAARGLDELVATTPPLALHPPDVARLTAVADAVDGGILVQPAVGDADPLDPRHHTRLRCLAAVLPHLPADRTLLAATPLHPRGDPEVDAALVTIVQRNHGATRHVTLDRPVEVERRLVAGLDVAGDATYPEVLTELRRAHPPRHRRGVAVLLTGLSGSGKSTVARALVVALLARGDRTVTLLDGDLVRKHLSAGLTFSREDRDRNVLRIGWVAAEIARHGGVAVCAPIAPYDATRRAVRRMVTDDAGAGFVLVHVATPLEVCEARDRKGLYAKARAGLIAGFTGVSDPYEPPADAEIVLDTSVQSPEEAAAAILAHLTTEGYLTT